MIAIYKYQGALFRRTFDTYDHVDCFNFMDLHDLLKSYKHGYSKVTDHANREIRHGRLTRNRAKQLVKLYENNAANHVEKFCDWLGLDYQSLFFILNQHRNPNIWIENTSGQWVHQLKTSKNSINVENT